MRDTIKETSRLFDRCGIPNKIVNDGVFGRIGEFEFTHRSYYTVVEGKVPLAIANELYNELFKGDIRSGGDCGCREPKTWAVYMKGDKVVMSRAEYENILKYAEPQDGGQVSEIAKKILKDATYHFPATEEERLSYPAHVQTYHIDTELGLYIFVQTLKKHGLI